MTPSAIAAEAKKAGLPASIALPTVDVAGKPIDTGTRARAFATYMRIHTLEATGGVPYAQMPRFATADGKGTNDATKALQANGHPVDNAARNLWVTETALTTALNTSYMAEQLALFGVVVGVALLLSGIGFAILAIGGALRSRRQHRRSSGSLASRKFRSRSQRRSTKHTAVRSEGRASGPRFAHSSSRPWSIA